MKTLLITLFTATVAAAFMLGAIFISLSNQEIRIRNMISAKQQDNESELDNMQKIILQNARVTKEQAAQIRGMIIEYAEGRSSNKEGGSFINAVSEAVPNMDTQVFTNLQNTITATRNAWTTRQKEILDMKREHDNLRATFPGSLFLSGRPEIKVQIITSTRAKENMETGVDDSTDIF